MGLPDLARSWLGEEHGEKDISHAETRSARREKTEEDLIEFGLLAFRILSPFYLDSGLCFLLRALRVSA